jgi:hypothetical protein
MGRHEGAPELSAPRLCCARHVLTRCLCACCWALCAVRPCAVLCVCCMSSPAVAVPTCVHLPSLAATPLPFKHTRTRTHTHTRTHTRTHTHTHTALASRWRSRSGATARCLTTALLGAWSGRCWARCAAAGVNARTPLCSCGRHHAAAEGRARAAVARTPSACWLQARSHARGRLRLRQRCGATTARPSPPCLAPCPNAPQDLDGDFVNLDIPREDWVSGEVSLAVDGTTGDSLVPLPGGLLDDDDVRGDAEARALVVAGVSCMCVRAVGLAWCVYVRWGRGRRRAGQMPGLACPCACACRGRAVAMPPACGGRGLWRPAMPRLPVELRVHA